MAYVIKPKNMHLLVANWV